MSRLYFHSLSGDAELAGPERHWLLYLAQGPGLAAWGLEGFGQLERAAEILAMVPEVPDGRHGANYLHRMLREAQVEDERHKAAAAGSEQAPAGVGR